MSHLIITHRSCGVTNCCGPSGVADKIWLGKERRSELGRLGVIAPMGLRWQLAEEITVIVRKIAQVPEAVLSRSIRYRWSRPQKTSCPVQPDCAQKLQWRQAESLFEAILQRTAAYAYRTADLCNRCRSASTFECNSANFRHDSPTVPFA